MVCALLYFSFVLLALQFFGWRMPFFLPFFLFCSTLSVLVSLTMQQWWSWPERPSASQVLAHSMHHMVGVTGYVQVCASVCRTVRLAVCKCVAHYTTY